MRECKSRTLTRIDENVTFEFMTEKTEKLSEWNKHIQTAERAQRSGHYEFAEATWLLAVEEAEAFGTKDHRLAYSLEKLTECLWFQGRLDEALRYGVRALGVYEAALGPSHNDVGSMAYNVAMVYHVLDQFPQAEKHYKRALAIKTGGLGAKHPDVVKVLSSFADLLVKLGRDDEARQLRATEKVVTKANWSQTNSGRDVGGNALGFSPSPGSVSGTYKSFRPTDGGVSGTYPQVVIEHGIHEPGLKDGAKPAHSSLIKQFRKFSAEKPYQPELAEPAPAVGSERSALDSQLMKALNAQDEEVDEKAAEPIIPSEPDYGELSARLVLPISGSHGRSFEELKAVAEKSLSEGNLTIAEGAWREAMTIAKGENSDNPAYCFVLESLGEVYLRQQNFERSESCVRTAYGIKQRVLGKDHVAVAMTASNLARLYYVMYKFDEAEKFGEESVRINEKISGANSVETATAMHNQATVFHVQKKYAQAEPYYERAMKIKQLQLGGDHPETVRILKSYAALLRATHREEQAEMLDQCVTGMISGRWRAVEIKPKDQPEEGWWKQAIFGDD